MTRQLIRQLHALSVRGDTEVGAVLAADYKDDVLPHLIIKLQWLTSLRDNESSLQAISSGSSFKQFRVCSVVVYIFRYLDLEEVS